MLNMEEWQKEKAEYETEMASLEAFVKTIKTVDDIKEATQRALNMAKRLEAIKVKYLGM